MNIHKKPLITLISGSILLCGMLCQTAQAGIITIESGSSQLADSLGVATGSEALTIGYTVTEDTVSDIYTYTYTVSNPSLDVLLGSGSPELVAFFAVDFDTSTPGAIVGGPTGVPFSFLEGVDTGGVYWQLLAPPVYAGTSSGPLSFSSDFGPTMGDASASDGNPPSPWGSTPGGQTIPVPAVPDSTSTATLLGGVLLLLPFRSNLKRLVRN